MAVDGKLLVLLVAVLAAAQGICWLLARGLGRRLERHAMALGLLLPLLLLSPWLDRSRLLVPSDVLEDSIPGAPVMPRSTRHDLLNDTVFQFLPWELEIRHALDEGRLPLWSDRLEGGSSPWVNPQAGALSPLAMLARALPIQHFLLALLALKLLVAFEGTWLLTRGVGGSRPAAVLAAAGFSWSGGMMAWGLFPHTTTLAWVPWLTLGTVRLFRRRDGRVVATAAVLTAILLLSGHPETAAIGGLFAAVCGLSLRARRRGVARGLGSATVAALLGFGLAAPHILPFLRHLPTAQRSAETLSSPLPAHTVTWRRPISWFLPGYGAFMLAPANPWSFGRPFEDSFRGPFNWVDAESGYAGLVAFAGSWLALFAWRLRRARPFWTFGLASLLLAARFLPIAAVLHAVPVLRAPAYTRFLPVGCLALTVAGALGLDAFLGGRRRRTGWLALGAGAAVSVAQNAAPWILLLWALVAVAALVGSRRRRWGFAVLGVVLLLDLVPWSRAFLPVGQPALFYPPSPLLATALREAPAATWRTVGEGYTVFPSLLPVYGLAEVRPHNPLAPVPYVRALRAAFGFAPSMDNYFPSFGGIDHPFLDFLNVRAVVWRSQDDVPPWFERIDDGRSPPFRLYRNPRALPRWFIPAAIDSVSSRDLEAWIAALRDPRRVALSPSGPADAALAPVFGASVTAESVRPGRIVLRVTAPAPVLVATSLGLPRGWRASTAGESLPTTVVNGAFLGIQVPAGARRVELRFIPPGLPLGLACAAAALLVSIALVARSLLKTAGPGGWNQDESLSGSTLPARRHP